MNLQQLVRDAFAPGGMLSRHVEEYKPRDGQIVMATAIARTIDAGGVLVVEAGTGIGKTFSYLVPALLSGARVIVSTATKALQDQLFGRDLPQVIKALGLSVNATLLKGRSSYLCLHRLDRARQREYFSDQVALRSLATIEQWSQVTRTGDLAELSGLDERSPAIPLVTSTRENCLGSHCPQFRRCHVNQARRDAFAADIVVINHHLFFSDLAVRESGMAELLPAVRTIIFDEAHQLNEIGVQFLGKQLTTGQLLDFARDLRVIGLQSGRGLFDWARLAVDFEHAARNLRMVIGPSHSGRKLRWTELTPEQVNATEWKEALHALQAAGTEVAAALDAVSESAPDLMRLIERCGALVERLVDFSALCPPDSVRWLDVGAHLGLVESPLDIAETIKTRLVAPTLPDASRCSWIFTSATLGDDARLSWFTEPCGLVDAEIMRVESPFDFANQAALYVPQHMQKPGEPDHSAQVAEIVARIASAIGGRTLVLTTTLRALRAVSDALQRQYGDANRLEILVQGQQPKRELIERFRQGSQGAKAGCILVGSASFWEGVDVPGESLQVVVIDKLPFPPPGDPLVEARARQLEAAGRSAFKHYYLPEATIALKQGAGRLIRRESDRGVLVVCDTRLTLTGYGKRLLAALPLMRKIGSESDLVEVLTALTKPSTTGPNSL